MVLHIMMDEKFTSAFVSFVNEHYNGDEHVFLVMSSSKQMRFAGAIKDVYNVVVTHKDLRGMYRIVKNMLCADKIILHGMFTKYIVYLMALLPVASKTYWCIWGGDLYDYKLDRADWKMIKTWVVSRLKAVITPLDGDYQLAKVAYKAKCKVFHCLAPNSIITNSVENLDMKHSQTGMTRKVLLGNSADSENRHYYLLDELKGYADSDIHIYIPLSYGDQKYAHEVAEYAVKIFGDKVTPMFDFMPLDAYKAFLRSIDVAIFAHKRQQAFSNIIQLLALGVKLYLEKGGSIWRFLNDQGIQAFAVDTVSSNMLEPISLETMQSNQARICKRCSPENLIAEWDLVFNDPEK